MGDFMDDYPVGAGWDEMFDAERKPRAPYAALYEVLQSLSADDFASRCAARDHAFRDQGITFSHSGEERPFPPTSSPGSSRRTSGRRSRPGWPSGSGPSKRS